MQSNKPNNIVSTAMSRDVDVFFVRQFALLSAVNFTTFAMGLMTTFPAVLNPAILAPDSEFKATPDQASWITACLSISGIFGYVLMPTIFDIFGRRAVNMVTNIVILIGCITYYFSKDIYALAFARLIQGFALPGLYVFVIGLAECICPKRRGYFLVLNKVALALGALACHSLVLVLDWRQIAIVTAMPACLSMIIVMICAESPSFYARKGQFDKCSLSFKWYKGDSLEAKKELKDLIIAQTEIYTIKQKLKHINLFKRARNVYVDKVFQKSLCIVTLAKLCLDFCGRYYMLAYLTDILIEVTNNTSLSMYLSILCDFIIIFALSISYFLVKHFDRRVLLFKLGFCSVALMFVVGLTLIVGNKLNVLQYVKWLTPTIIMVHLFVTNVGLIPLVFTLSGEIFALEHRALGLFSSGVIFLGFYTLMLKYTPFLIATTGVEGVYLIYGSCLLILLWWLRHILIETKDKTLQQIENELKGKGETETETELLRYPKDNIG